MPFAVCVVLGAVFVVCEVGHVDSIEGGGRDGLVAGGQSHVV
jgi:hypothetical protein